MGRGVSDLGKRLLGRAEASGLNGITVKQALEAELAVMDEGKRKQVRHDLSWDITRTFRSLVERGRLRVTFSQILGVPTYFYSQQNALCSPTEPPASMTAELAGLEAKSLEYLKNRDDVPPENNPLMGCITPEIVLAPDVTPPAPAPAAPTSVVKPTTMPPLDDMRTHDAGGQPLPTRSIEEIAILLTMETPEMTARRILNDKQRYRRQHLGHEVNQQIAVVPHRPKAVW